MISAAEENSARIICCIFESKLKSIAAVLSSKMTDEVLVSYGRVYLKGGVGRTDARVAEETSQISQ